MNKTRIEYVDFTWNPITGCLGPRGTASSPARCNYCFAHRLARGRLKNLYLSNKNEEIVPSNIFKFNNDPFWPRYWHERLLEPYFRQKPARIFCCDMADLFHEAIPRGYIKAILALADKCPQHTFLFLTKNPSRYKEFGPWSKNQWLGTTITTQEDYEERWPPMSELDANTFVSFEPLLEQVSMSHYFLSSSRHPPHPDWIIIGALTGPKAQQPKKDWVYLLAIQADVMEIPVFYKDNLSDNATMRERRREIPNG